MKTNKIATFVLKFLTILIMIAMAVTSIAASPAPNTITNLSTSRSYKRWTNKMIIAHELADQARSIGVADNDPIIIGLQKIWNQENNDLQMIAKTISHEASTGCPWWHQVAVGAVILNRVKSPRFPNSVYEVLIAPKQYSRSYTYGFNNIADEYYAAAIAAMNGEHNVPENVFYQAQFVQGTGIWKTSPVKTPYWSSITYFCFG